MTSASPDPQRNPRYNYFMNRMGLFLLFLLSGPLYAQGRNPVKHPTPAETAEQKANETLDAVEKNVKAAAKKAKKAGNEALQKVDEGVHKALKPTQEK